MIKHRIELIMKLLEKSNELSSFRVGTNGYKKMLLDFKDVIMELGAPLEHIDSSDTSHYFKNDNNEFMIKFSPIPKINNIYGEITDDKRPENAEIKILYLLKKLVTTKQTPHIILPIAYFYTPISEFTNLKDVVQSEKYEKFMENVKSDINPYYDIGCVLITEYPNRSTLFNFINKKYSNSKFTLIHWKVIFFQILSVLAIIQDNYPSFRHNNLTPNNIFVTKFQNQNNKPILSDNYFINKKKYYVDNICYKIMLGNFDFASITKKADNNKYKLSNDVIHETNKYYDVHYFFNSLNRQIPIMESSFVPKEVKEFIDRVLPEIYRDEKRYVNDDGRLISSNNEYKTPLQLIENDPFFDEFRSKEKHPNMGVGEKNVEFTEITETIEKPQPAKLTIRIPFSDPVEYDISHCVIA